MDILFRSVITEIGPEVPDLLEGGVLILFAAGAPAELAEVSVQHRIVEQPRLAAPEPGSDIQIGDVTTTITGVGEQAWAKVRDIGHVVINFNGLDTPERPGEICASQANLEALAASLRSGAEIVISV